MVKIFIDILTFNFLNLLQVCDLTSEADLVIYSTLSAHVMPSLLILSEIFLFLTFLLHVLVPEFRKPIFGKWCPPFSSSQRYSSSSPSSSTFSYQSSENQSLVIDAQSSENQSLVGYSGRSETNLVSDALVSENQSLASDAQVLENQSWVGYSRSSESKKDGRLFTGVQKTNIWKIIPGVQKTNIW